MLQHEIYYPSEALRPFISHYIFWKMEAKAHSNSLHDYPRTAMDFVFLFEGNIQLDLGKTTLLDLNRCSFIGHFDKVYNIHYQQDVLLLNVRFHPNGVYPLTKIPLKKAFNNYIELEDFLPKDSPIENLHERLAGQPTNKTKIATLEHFLSKVYQVSDLHHRLDHGIQYIQQQQGLITVQELCQKLNTNYKSLNRWFDKNVGLSPKRFIQITRFKHLLGAIEDQKQLDWMELVTDYNFHDQAHFVKEFKQFAGKTPTAYRATLQSNANMPSHIMSV